MEAAYAWPLAARIARAYACALLALGWIPPAQQLLDPGSASKLPPLVPEHKMTISVHAPLGDLPCVKTPGVSEADSVTPNLVTPNLCRGERKSL